MADGPPPASGRKQAWIWAIALSLLFFFVSTAASWARWANFDYRTFDLAYYVQGLWQLIHGRTAVSVLNVPLLGNHVEPIVLLFAPFFYLWPHPMLPVSLQNAALASMGVVAFAIARRLGLAPASSLALAAALLIAPATLYIGLHEFHPEALAAPFLLLLFHARLRGSWRQHLIWFLAVLSCKENMALLLVAYGLVQAFLERKRGVQHLWRWFLAPALAALLWFAVAVLLITPRLNAGNIDYLALYSRLGGSMGEILTTLLTKPHVTFGVMRAALTSGNLVWGLLLPFLCLPLLRPHWLLIGAPILLQHLLSWRSSEWLIYFHYSAPLLPLFWMAAAESIAWLGTRFSRPSLTAWLPRLVLLACLAAQLRWGSFDACLRALEHWSAGYAERQRKEAFLRKIPPEASVMAPLPYLSHLALREELQSLHYILKGLKTLSRERFTPPQPTEFVFIDYGDAATFDAVSGYYHPEMRTVDGQIVPASDQLLHRFLRAAKWKSEAQAELTLLTKTNGAAPATPGGGNEGVAKLADGTVLVEVGRDSSFLTPAQPVTLRIGWRFPGERTRFPWVLLRLSQEDKGALLVNRGLSAPEARAGTHYDVWSLPQDNIPAGIYRAELLVTEHPKISDQRIAPSVESLLLPPIPLGELTVRSR